MVCASDRPNGGAWPGVAASYCHWPFKLIQRARSRLGRGYSGSGAWRSTRLVHGVASVGAIGVYGVVAPARGAPQSVISPTTSTAPGTSPRLPTLAPPG